MAGIPGDDTGHLLKPVWKNINEGGFSVGVVFIIYMHKNYQ